MQKNTAAKLTCAALCAALLALSAGCVGKTTYLTPTESDLPQSSAESPTSASSPASAAESSTEQSSADEQSSAAEEQSSKPEDVQQSSAAQTQQSSDSGSAPQTTVEIPDAMENVPQGDKQQIGTKDINSAAEGAASDASASALGFISTIQSVVNGTEGRFVVSLLSLSDEESEETETVYTMSMTDIQNSGGATYIQSSFEDNFAEYELCFLQKDGSTYQLDDSTKTYYVVGNDDIKSDPYREVTSLSSRFTSVSESGSCKYNGSSVSYERYDSSGETLVIYYTGKTVLGGEIYDRSSGKLKSIVYADINESIDSSHTSLPADYQKEG